MLQKCFSIIRLKNKIKRIKKREINNKYILSKKNL